MTSGDNMNRISELEKDKKELGEQLKAVQLENERLKEALNLTEKEFEKNRRACLSQEQTATLLQDLVSDESIDYFKSSHPIKPYRTPKLFVTL
mgnify:CR=1 FL=1